MAKNQRVVDNAFLNSPNDVESIEYNPAAGAQKALIVGPRLLPIPIVTAGSPTWSTDISSVTGIPYIGANLAIYNNSSTAEAVTVGQDATVTAQAIGAFDSNGNVGVACPPNTYTYVSMGANQWIIGTSANLIAYIIEDPTSITRETGPYVQQNNGNTQPIS